MSVRVRPIIMFVAECTEPECGWRQPHTDIEAACTDAKNHRREWHPRAHEEATCP